MQLLSGICLHTRFEHPTSSFSPRSSVQLCLSLCLSIYSYYTTSLFCGDSKEASFDCIGKRFPSSCITHIHYQGGASWNACMSTLGTDSLCWLLGALWGWVCDTHHVRWQAQGALRHDSQVASKQRMCVWWHADGRPLHMYTGHLDVRTLLGRPKHQTPKRKLLDCACHFCQLCE